MKWKELMKGRIKLLESFTEILQNLIGRQNVQSKISIKENEVSVSFKQVFVMCDVQPIQPVR